MSYGYARTELIGAMLNACFLLSLSFYIILECIPRFIFPVSFESNIGMLFIYIAAAGLGANTLGTIVFCSKSSYFQKNFNSYHFFLK